MTQHPQGRAPIVHLGFDGCGGVQLARMFSDAGLPVLCWDGGAAAREIAWREAAGQGAPGEWSRLSLLTELHGHDHAVRPPFEAFRRIDWLDRHMAGALFLMTTRDVERWVLDRLGATDMRRSAAMTALHRGCAVSALPELWAADWEAHLRAVRARFGGRPDYLEIDLEEMGWDGLRDLLSPLVPALAGRPARKGRVLARGLADPGRVMAMLDDDRPSPRARGGAMAAATLDRLVENCLGRIRPDDAGLPGASLIYAWFDGTGTAYRRDGTPWPIASTGQGFHAQPGVGKIERLEAVLNDLAELGTGRPVQIDMQDGRRFGSDAATAIGQPILTYARRAGAENVVLWPLAGFHSIGNPDFARAPLTGEQGFADKEDRLIWRGNLSGNALDPDGKVGRTGMRLLAQIAAAPRPRARERLAGMLGTVPRLATLRRLAHRPDMDLGLVLSHALREHGHLPEIAPLVRPRLSLREMLRCRYQLCLAGFDVGTNFIWAANSNSVVLKEEAGWEVYYTCLFRPWEHYIPVAEGCHDLEERLDWARAHPAECQAMSAAARAVVAQLSDHRAQREMMRRVAAALPAVPPPF